MGDALSAFIVRFMAYSEERADFMLHVLSTAKEPCELSLGLIAH